MGNNIFPGREILPEILPLQTTDKHHRQQLDWQGRTSAQPVSDNLTIWHGVSFSGEILSRSIFYQSVSVQEPRHSFYYFKNISLRFCFPNVLNLLIKFEAFTKLDHCRLPTFVSHSQTTIWNKEKEFMIFRFISKDIFRRRLSIF